MPGKCESKSYYKKKHLLAQQPGSSLSDLACIWVASPRLITLQLRGSNSNTGKMDQIWSNSSLPDHNGLHTMVLHMNMYIY